MFPIKTPIIEIIKVVIPINVTDSQMDKWSWLPIVPNVIPTANASMLVAIASPKSSLIPTTYFPSVSSSSFPTDSLIMFAPIIVKSTNVTQWLYALMYSTNFELNT